MGEKLSSKMSKVPTEALASIHEFLIEVREKLSLCLVEMRDETTKIDQETIQDLALKSAKVDQMLAKLQATLGYPPRGNIASYTLAAEFEQPIFTTSRSGRLGSWSPSNQNLYAA